MKKLMGFLACGVFLFALTLPILAGTRTPGINQRQARQQARINQGIRSGQLTYREARGLESREGKIQADKLFAKSDGKVTPAERRQLNRELNRTSRGIYRQKHDGQTR
ncbi:MAG: hypothetical protein LAO21_11620 [Acidobacteriia bacterium]|nr:hypothetical protein [Terriglobia bacterium]